MSRKLMLETMFFSFLKQIINAKYSFIDFAITNFLLKNYTFLWNIRVKRKKKKKKQSYGFLNTHKLQHFINTSYLCFFFLLSSTVVITYLLSHLIYISQHVNTQEEFRIIFQEKHYSITNSCFT